MPTEPLKENFTEKLAGVIVAEYGSFAPPILRLLRAQPNPEERARAILDHPTARERIGTLALHAPILLNDPILDILLEPEPAQTTLSLPLDALPATVAREVLSHRLRILTAWVLGEEKDPSQKLTELHESLLSHIHRRLQLSFSIIALGSLASGDLAPNSNLNLLLVAESKDAQRNDLETHAPPSLPYKGSTR